MRINDNNKIIITVCLMGFILYFSIESISIALPTMVQQLSISPVLANWISIAGLLLTVAIEIPCGKIIPKFGIVKYSKIGMTVFMISTIITIITNNIYVIIFGRLLLGISLGILAISSMLLITYQIPKNKLGYALGLVGFSSAFAALVSPIIGGLLITYSSWKVLFSFTFPFALIILISLLTFNKEWYHEKININNKSSLLYILAVVLIIFGLSNLNTANGLLPLIIGLILIIIVIYYEIKSEHPIYDFNLLKDKKYVINNYTALVHRLAKSGVTIVLSLYLQNVRGLSATVTGTLIAVIALMMMFFSPLSGKLSDTYNAVLISKIGLILMTVSSILLCFIDSLTNTSLLLLLIMFGTGIGTFESSNRKLILNTSHKEQLGSASSFLSTMRDMGDILGVAMFTVILGTFTGINEYWIVCSEITLILISIFLISALLLFYVNKYYKVIYKYDIDKIMKTFNPEDYIKIGKIKK